MLSRLPEEARSRAEALLNGRSPQDLSDEERQQLRQMMQAARGGGGQRQGGGGQRQGGGQGGFGGAPGGFGGGPGGFGGAPGGFGGAPGGFGGTQGAGGGRQPAEQASGTNSSGFNEAERQQAQLPEPPQEGSDVDVLLRPGLLADAEVTVETIASTLYIPNQAVFEEGAQAVVFVLESGQLRPRRVELGRRSESQIAVVSGLQEGDMVSLYRPEDSGPPAPSQSTEPSGGPSFPGGGRSR